MYNNGATITAIYLTCSKCHGVVGVLTDLGPSHVVDSCHPEAIRGERLEVLHLKHGHVGACAEAVVIFPFSVFPFPDTDEIM